MLSPYCVSGGSSTLCHSHHTITLGGDNTRIGVILRHEEMSGSEIQSNFLKVILLGSGQFRA